MKSQQHINFRLWFTPAQFSVGVQLPTDIDLCYRKNEGSIETKKRLRLYKQLS